MRKEATAFRLVYMDGMLQIVPHCGGKISKAVLLKTLRTLNKLENFLIFAAIFQSN